MIAKLSGVLLLAAASSARPDEACVALMRGDTSARARCHDPCLLFGAGDQTQGDKCANAELAGLRRDNYGATVGTLDGIGEPAVPALLKALASDSALTRAGAADALGRMGMRLEKKAPIVDALVSHAGDADRDVRIQVIGAIGRVGLKTPAAEEAVRKAESDSDTVVRALATLTLAQLKAPPASQRK